MKVYEIGVRNFCNDQSDHDCTFWIACDHRIQMVSSDDDVYIKEIPDYDETSIGVDFIIK